MKKLMFFAAIACIAFASCEKQVIDPSANEDNAITFKTFTGKTTAGTKAITDLTALQTSGFNLLAYYTGQDNFETVKSTITPNYMYDQKVTYVSSAWTYSPLKYWPNNSGDKISFFGYAPKETNVTTISGNTATGYPTITFTQNADNDIDLVVANTMNQTKTANAVGLAFKHALTRVAIKAKIEHSIESEGPDTKVFITDIAIDNGTSFFTSGTFTYDGTPTVGAWTNQAGPAAGFNLVLQKTAASWGGYTVSSVALPQDATSISFLGTSVCPYLFFVPSTSGIAADAVKITVKYDIVTKDAAINGGHSIASHEVTKSLTAGTLLMGKAYGFTLEVSMVGIQVSATVEDWGTETGSNI